MSILGKKPIYFLYDPDNYTLIGARKGRPSTVVVGKWVYPDLPNITTVEPPQELPGKFISIFNPTTESWRQVVDRRGQTYYDSGNREYVANTIEFELPAGFSWSRFPMEVADARKARKLYIEELRSKALVSEQAVVTTPSNNLSWRVDPSSLDELTRVITLSLAVGGTPPGLVWRDLNNINHPADLELLSEIGMQVMVRNSSIWSRSWVLKEYIDTLTDKDEILKVDWETDIPE